MKFTTYLFSQNPGSEFKYYIPLAAVICLLFIGAFVISLIHNSRKKYDFAFKRLFRKTSLHLTLFAILFLVLAIMRYERIPYFSMRIWIFLSIIWFAYFILKTIKKLLKDYPREKENVKNLSINSTTKTVHKYLPNKNKR